MMNAIMSKDTILDYITGQKVPNIGAEENRQVVEHYLVEEKQYQKQDIEVDAPIELEIQGERYRSFIDLVVSIEGNRFMAIKCVAGSLDSWRREIVSASRLIHRVQLPLSSVSDGKTAIVLDTLSGRKIQEGLQAIPSRSKAKDTILKNAFRPLPKDRMEREKLIFRSYDMMRVNVKWKNPDKE